MSGPNPLDSHPIASVSLVPNPIAASVSLRNWNAYDNLNPANGNIDATNDPVVIKGSSRRYSNLD